MKTLILTGCDAYKLRDFQGGFTIYKNIPFEVEDDVATHILETGRFQIAEDVAPLLNVIPQVSQPSQHMLDDASLQTLGIARDAAITCVHKPQNTLTFAQADELQHARILLKRFGGIGDVVFVTQVAQYLKQIAPTCTITLAVDEAYVAFARIFTVIDNVITLATAARSETVATFTHIVHFNGVFPFEEGGNKSDDTSYMQLHFERAGLANKLPATFPALRIDRLQYDNMALNEASTILQTTGIGDDAYVVLLLGTSNPLKQMTPKVLADIAQGIASGERRKRVLAIGGANDRRFIVEDAANACVHFATSQALPVSAELIRRASLVIGPDTGLMHLAAAMGVPTVSVWGCTDAQLTMPRYVNADKVQAHVCSVMDCAPCRTLKASLCPFFSGNYADCCKRVDTHSVVQHAKQLLRKKVYEKSMQDFEKLAQPQVALQNTNAIQQAFTSQGCMRVAVLIDNGATYSGGGFYLWQLVKSFTRLGNTLVHVYTDSDAFPYFDDDFPLDARTNTRHDAPNNLEVFVVDSHDLREWDQRYDNTLGEYTYNDACIYDLVIAQPPIMGAHACAHAKQHNTKALAVVYETPNYIATYRKGRDTQEDYWASYKQALLEADLVLTISQPVRKALLEWLPQLGHKERNTQSGIAPVINSAHANALFPVPNNSLTTFKKLTHKADSIVMIARNMQYKNLNDALVGIAGWALTTKRIVDVHVIGTDLQALKKNVLGSWTIRLHLHESLSERDKWELIHKAKALVHASDFEGFGIPVAEALYAYTPVICHPLPVLKFCFAERNLHLYTDNKSLATQLQKVFTAWDEQTKKFLASLLAGRKHVATRYIGKSMDRQLARVIVEYLPDLLQQKIQRSVEQRSATATLALRVAYVTPWNNRCGIAETTKQFTTSLGCTYRVFAPLEPKFKLQDEDDARVVRCWERNFMSYANLLNALENFNPHVVHIEHEFSFFQNERVFIAFLLALRERKYKTVITLHTYLPSHIVDTIAQYVDCIVFTKLQLDHALPVRTEVIELPIQQVVPISQTQSRQQQQLGQHDFVVGAFGFWQSHKGYHKLLETMNDVMLKMNGRTTRYVLLGHYDEKSMYYRDTVTPYRVQMQNDLLRIDNVFLPYEEVINRIAAFDVVVFPYEVIMHSSASAALRTGLSTGVPTVCSTSPMFSEFEDGKYVLKYRAGETQELIEQIVRAGTDEAMQTTLRKNTNLYVREHAPVKVAQRHEQLYLSLIDANEKDASK